METTRKIAIIATRTTPIDAILKALRDIEREQNETIILLTGGHTAETAASLHIEERLYEHYDTEWDRETYEPDWKKYGKGAGAIRSWQMLQQADEAITLWDGQSKGAQNEMKQAQKLGLKMTHYGKKPKGEQAQQQALL
jgi:hypothetical protein